MRVDPYAEMGTTGFIKTVYSFRCNDLHFLEYFDGKFFLMDDKKRIRELEQDPLNYMLTLTSTLDVPKNDKLNIKHSDFDEFCMSSELFHWDNRVMFFSETKNFDGYTFGSLHVMADNHKFIQGPKVAKGTEMIFYLEKYEAVDEEVIEEDELLN